MSVNTVFRGRIIRLTTETAHLPNGATAEFEIVHHPGGAAVVAIDAQQRVCLLKQFRHAFGRWLWELPAGKLDDGEPPDTCARRELREEAGQEATRWETLGPVISSPGVFTEVVHLYLARDLRTVPAQAEEHEVFDVHWLPWPEAMAMAQQGEIEDAKTLVGLFRAAERLRTPPH